MKYDNFEVARQLLNGDEARMEWVDSLQQGSPVGKLAITVSFGGEECVDVVHEDGSVEVNGGHIFENGAWRKNGNTTVFLIEPEKEMIEDYVARKKGTALREFPWRALTAGQLDAVLKYANEKLEIAKARAIEAGAA